MQMSLKKIFFNLKKKVSYNFAVSHEDAIIIHARIIVYFKTVSGQLDSNITKALKQLTEKRKYDFH